ncbi:5-(carboxyamino)imidazole ribonucleotide synthase [Rosistilla oblonga]|uniref:5-(carboxyamino)imidazole ribonucleotide synthase n=1 Tax=Rosistilla oblonga TaxID=2527990 RepID=UPI003A968BFF
MNPTAIVPPGSTIGVFGSGQLGRMFTMVAKQMGYRVVIYSPDADSPAGQVADREIVAQYDDQSAVEDFARQCDVITLEFENIPVETVGWAGAITPVHPDARVLHVAQDRIIEKQTLADAGLPVTPFRPVFNADDVRRAADELGYPIVLKTARSGYDGKGQRILRDPESIEAALAELGSDRLVAEKMIDFQREVSILVYRSRNGSVGTYPLIENHHANHILDYSICPAAGSDTLRDAARQIALTTAKSLDLVGLLCIELFVQSDDRLLINELAPRPHNSGHLTIEAFPCCQYQQLLRAICGLPLGTEPQTRPAAMANLLGDVWDGGAPAFENALAIEAVQLHLYGKQDAVPGRKMGHLTATADSIEAALANVLAARDQLKR